jgi:glucosamine-phosphate N-acetyltransferase
MIVLRKLEKNDFENGYLKLLSQLTDIGNKNSSDYLKKIEEILLNKNIEIWILYDDIINKLIGSGTIFIEPKLIHGCSNVGHIEDIVIDENHRNRGAGKLLINHLVERALIHKCYKVVLYCDDKNVDFYKKYSFTSNGVNMVKYF